MEEQEENMVSLLSQFELLHKGYKEAMLEVRKLRTKLSMEVQKREAAEAFSRSIEQERQRLLKTQGEAFSKMVQQLELRSHFDDMMDELKSLKLQLESKEAEQKELLKAVIDKNSTEICALQNQIRQSQDELTLRDAAVAHLEQELSCLRSTMRDFQLSSEKALKDANSKYQLEITEMKSKLELLAQDRNLLEDCLVQEKNMLQDRLESVEKQLSTERADFEKRLRDSSFSRHSEILKQKIMRLRKENEDLRRQLHGDIRH